jgi:hypothetical protein
MGSDPLMQKAACQGGPNCKSSTNTSDNSEITNKLQALRLVSKFGFSFETAVTISQLAWGICK